MAQAAQVDAKSRNELGSRANKRLRDSGFVPGVIYGHKEAVVPVTLPKKALVGHINQGAHLFDLSVDGRSEKCLVKEVQYDHLGIEVLHIDFARVSLDEKVEITVALELRGTPKGEDDGGVLQQVLNELHVECLVTDIPNVIRHSVADMALNDVLHIRDLKLPDGVKALQDPDQIVATVKEILDETAEAVVAPVEGAAEPEIIGKKKEDGEAAEGEAAPAAPKK